MPDYRRYRVPGGTYFFTINLLERRADLLVRHIEPLREGSEYTRADRPFHIDAWVVLPDHMHCVITLPPGDDDFSSHIKAMKIRFVQALPPREGVHRYEWRRVNVVSGNDVFGSMLFGTREIMRAIWTTCTSTRLNTATCRWLRTGPIRPLIGGRRQVPIHAIGVARVRWMVLQASVADNVVACHSAEHPCGASALRGLRAAHSGARLTAR
jgi:REP element-mobilizing transposase RayT